MNMKSKVCRHDLFLRRGYFNQTKHSGLVCMALLVVLMVIKDVCFSTSLIPFSLAFTFTRPSSCFSSSLSPSFQNFQQSSSLLSFLDVSPQRCNLFRHESDEPSFFYNTRLYATSKKGRPKKKASNKNNSSKAVGVEKKVVDSMKMDSKLQGGSSQEEDLPNLSDEEQEAKVQAMLNKRFKGMGNEDTVNPSIQKQMKNTSKKNSKRLDQKMDVFGASPLSGRPALNDEPVPAGKKKVLVKNVDIFTMIPASVQNGFETSLIVLLSLNLLALLAVGISFTFGAYAVSTGAQIPSYITSTIKPWEDYFNPLTASFFAISILLGSFKVAQLSSGDNEYVEYIEDE